MKNSYAIIAMIVIAIVVGGGVYGVMASAAPSSASTVTSTVTTTSVSTATTSSGGSGINSPIKVGVLEPLSGALAGPGQGIVDAIKLAALQIVSSEAIALKQSLSKS
ncbi:MAG: hypothetical protein JRN15_19015 [Nitrososphaerota archaeon]|nr:hypothetical protein [Nitrososphaerota archaeon]